MLKNNAIGKPIRVFRVCPEMPYLNLFKKNISISKSFKEIQQLYEDENLFFPKGWLKSEHCNDYLVENVIYADYLSQSAWARENGYSCYLLNYNFLEKILLLQIESFKADIIFFNTGSLYRVNRNLRNQIRVQCKSVKLITGSWGDELPEGMTYKSYLGDLDLIFSCTIGYYDDIKKENINTEYLPSSFNEYVNYKLPEKKVDVCFIGATGYLEVDHYNRFVKLDKIFKMLAIENIKFSLVTKEKQVRILTRIKYSVLLNQLAHELPAVILKIFRKIAILLDISGVIDFTNKILLFKQYKLSSSLFLLNLKKIFTDDKTYKYLNNKPLSKKYKSNCSSPYLYAEDYYHALAESKIVINLHRDEENDFGNIRCFEAAGVGSCLLTDRAEMISNLFKIDSEIVGFNTPAECVAKIKKLLADPLMLKKISENAFKRVRLDHLQSNRDKIIDNTFSNLLRGSGKNSLKKESFIYDLRKYPLSYDYIFFLQYCYIKGKSLGCKVSVNIILPDLSNLPKSFDWTYDEFLLRKTRIINQLNLYFSEFEFYETISSNNLPNNYELPSHTEFYKYVNEHSDSVNPIFSKADSVEYIVQWKKKRSLNKYITFTIRDSKVSIERNTDITLLNKFIEYYQRKGFGIVVIPDTNCHKSLDELSGKYINYLAEASYDYDIRLAIYENADINFFNNNGPCIAAGLNPNISYLLTKIIVPSVPHCTIEFIERQGFKYGTTPSYSNNSIWLWGDEDFDYIINNAEKLIE